MSKLKTDRRQIEEIAKYSFYREKLHNKPDKTKSRDNPKVLFFKNYKADCEAMEYSIVMPIYNQQNIIQRNIKSVLLNTLDTYELILILDGCSDNTEEEVLSLFTSLNNVPSNLIKVTVLILTTSIYETACDNLGFVLAEAPFIIEIQADMEMTTLGYNKLLKRLVDTCGDDIFMVSGRASCNVTANMKKIKGHGKLGSKVSEPLHISYDEMNKYYIDATICRGPLLIVKEKLERLGYLDEHNFVQGGDDIDISLRAYDKYKWVVGYYPLEFYAPLQNSTMQKNKKIKNSYTDEHYKERVARSDGGFLKRVQTNMGKFNLVKQSVRMITQNKLLENV